MPDVVAISTCPDRDTWSGFYAGKRGADELPALAAHLDQCPACQSVLEELADTNDALIDELRGATPDPFEDEAECRQALERVKALVPCRIGGRTDERADTVPERLGEYRILQLIGRGGMGAVYRAVHIRLGREVALKIVPPGRARDASARARFYREMAALGKLDHPNVVRATVSRWNQADALHRRCVPFRVPLFGIDVVKSGESEPPRLRGHAAVCTG
jgi:hypothetical protein